MGEMLPPQQHVSLVTVSNNQEADNPIHEQKLGSPHNELFV